MFDQIHLQRKLPFSLLSNEKVSSDDFLGNDLRGRIVLTNFRIFAKPSDHKSLFYNIPMRLIDYLSNPEGCILKVYCRHGFAISLKFPTNSRALEAYNICNDILANDTTRFEIEYAFVPVPNQNTMSICDYKRLGLSCGSFKVIDVNKGRTVCESYPEYCSIPANILDSDLARAAKFRASSRFVSIVYRHKPNGVCIARCAQPAIGILCSRNVYDEQILKALGNTKSHNQTSNNQSICPLYIVDARDNTSAYLNRARGGGYEYEEYYVGSKIHFMHIPNIHYVRSALYLMRDLILESNTSLSSIREKFHSMDWPKYISMIIKSAFFVVEAVHKNGVPVLVHCSDGWDRTPQIVSLSKLCLDPYYRTIKGFCVLIETEWIAFGHQFPLRCNSGKDCKERSPVFLQFLDCVHQLLHLYPKFFEFNQSMLIKIGLHSYLNFFENFDNSHQSEFQFNNDDICCSISNDLIELRFPEKRQSIWSFILENERFKNILYDQNQEQYKVLFPELDNDSVLFWQDMYMHGLCMQSDMRFELAGELDVNHMQENWPEKDPLSPLSSLIVKAQDININTNQLHNNNNVEVFDKFSNCSLADNFDRQNISSLRRKSDSMLVWAESPTLDSDSCLARSPFELLDPDISSYSKSDHCIYNNFVNSGHNCFNGLFKTRSKLDMITKSLLSLLRRENREENKLHTIRDQLEELKLNNDKIQRKKDVNFNQMMLIDIDGLIINTTVSINLEQNSYLMSNMLQLIQNRNIVLENTVYYLADYVYNALNIEKQHRQTLPDMADQRFSSEMQDVEISANNSVLNNGNCNNTTILQKSFTNKDCNQCGLRLRWTLRAKERCRFCNASYCKLCCNNLVTLAPSTCSYDNYSKCSVHKDKQNGNVQCKNDFTATSKNASIQPIIFRICSQCIQLHLGKCIKLFNDL